MRSQSDLLLVLGFGAALLAPALAWRLDPAAWIALERENRLPAPFPELPRDTLALREFPRKVELWQADTLGLRSPLLYLNNLAALRLWRKLPSETLLLGREDWIFYTGEDSRRIWRGLYPIPRDFAANWTAALRSRAAWFARRGIAYLYVVAPNKESVYADRLPPGEEPQGPTLLESLARGIEAQPELPLLDLRAALLDERAQDRPEQGDFVFHPLGSHWTERGGWRAAQAIAQRLEQLYPELGPLSVPARETCAVSELPAALEDSWAGSLHLEELCTQRVFAFRTREPRTECCSALAPDLKQLECLFERPDGVGPRLLLVHDSFGPRLREPLAELGARVQSLWDEELPLARIQAEAPRVLVEVRTERRLRDAPLWFYDALDALAPETCAALRELEALPAGPGAIEGIAPQAGSRIEADPAGGVRVESPDGSARVQLSGWRPGPGGRLVLELVLHAPAATEATLWYQTRDEPRFHPRRNNVLRLEAGRNELCLLLPEAGIQGPLLLRPGAAPGSYRIERSRARSRY